MGWADHYIKILSDGGTAIFRPRGNSMTPRIKSGDLVRVEPITDVYEIRKNDIVLCRVNGRQYLHLVLASDEKKGFQIGNMRGNINGWTHQVYGKFVQKE